MEFNKYILIINLLLLILFFKEGNMSNMQSKYAKPKPKDPMPKWISWIRNQLWGGNNKKAASVLDNFDYDESNNDRQMNATQKNVGHVENGR